MAALATSAGPALGLDASGVDAVSVPQLQTPTQLPETPGASVPVPEVPQVSTPSAPEDSTPSTPQAETPSTPQVETPSESPSTDPAAQSTTGDGGGTAGSDPAASPGASVPGASDPGASAPAGSVPTGSDPTGSDPGSAFPGAWPGEPSSSAAARGGRGSWRIEPLTPEQARAVHRAREQYVRAEVRRLSGCLPSLDDLDRRFLTLRAGLEGPPLSRGAAARELGIPRADARRVEHRGLRALQSACGIFIGTSSGETPSFQPASLLAGTGGTDPGQLVGSELGGGSQPVDGELQTSRPSHNDGAAESPSTADPLATASPDGSDSTLIAIASALVLMAAGALLALRRRRSQPAGPVPAESPHPATVWTAPPLGPARRGEAIDPEAEQDPRAPVPGPPPPAAPPQTRHHGATRSAAMLASGALSFVAREFTRRRGGGRR